MNKPEMTRTVGVLVKGEYNICHRYGSPAVIELSWKITLFFSQSIVIFFLFYIKLVVIVLEVSTFVIISLKFRFILLFENRILLHRHHWGVDKKRNKLKIYFNPVNLAYSTPDTLLVYRKKSFCA